MIDELVVLRYRIVQKVEQLSIFNCKFKVAGCCLLSVVIRDVSPIFPLLNLSFSTSFSFVRFSLQEVLLEVQ